MGRQGEKFRVWVHFMGGRGRSMVEIRPMAIRTPGTRGLAAGGGQVLNNGVPYVGAERKRGQGRQVCLASPRRPALCPPQIKG